MSDRAVVRWGTVSRAAGRCVAVPVTLLRSRRHVDLCRTATALCRA